MTVTRTLFVSLILIICLVAGCGGGGGGSTVSELTSDVRAMQPGDTWVYQVTGMAGSGTSAIPVAGTITKTVTTNTVTRNDSTLRVVTWSGTVAGVGYSKTLSSKEYVTQDTTGTIWIYGGEDEGGVYWVVTPQSGRNEYVWSPMTSGNEWGVAEEIDGPDGTVSFDRHYQVTGSAAITVPAGQFETYTVNGTGFFAGSPSTENLWWAPQIGAPVQMHIQSEDTASGKNLDLTFKLSASSR